VDESGLEPQGFLTLELPDYTVQSLVITSKISQSIKTLQGPVDLILGGLSFYGSTEQSTWQVTLFVTVACNSEKH
jgi:hypothetical protein